MSQRRGWDKILIDMFNHFEAFLIKPRFFNKQVGDRGLDVVFQDLLPLTAGNLVVFGHDECLGDKAGEVGRAAEAGIDDFLGVNPGVLVCDVLEFKVGGFVLDHNDSSSRRAGIGMRRDRGVQGRVFKNGDDQVDIWLHGRDKGWG